MRTTKIFPPEIGKLKKGKIMCYRRLIRPSTANK